MKTTNRILLTLFFLILAGISIALIYFRVQLNHTAEIMGTGNVITQERSLGAFDAVQVNGNFNVGIVSFNHLVSSGSQSSLNLHIDSLHLESSAGSRVEIKGFARTVQAKANSGAQIRTSELTADIYRIVVSSGANAHVHVNNELHVNANGSGSHVRYTGSPTVQNVSTSGGANVSPL